MHAFKKRCEGGDANQRHLLARTNPKKYTIAFSFNLDIKESIVFILVVAAQHDSV